MTWNDDLELSLKAEPIQDKLYREVWGDKIKIVRSHNKETILDREFHIDLTVELPNGIQLLGQEKALRHKFASFNTFTLEFYQNMQTQERGEFFRLGAQFYCHGYLNEEETDFEKVYIIKIFDFLASKKDVTPEWLEAYTRPSSGRASFYYVEYDKIPKEFIYYKKI